MKKTALFVAAATLFAAAPQVASAGSGYIGAEYNTGEASILLGDADAEGFQGEGAVGFGGGGWGGQFNAAIGNLELEDTGLDFDHWSAGGHLWWNGGGWRLGGVIATSQFDAGGGADFDETIYGLEGTFDAGPNTVLLGSVTFGEGDFGGLFDYDTWNADVGVNFYPTSNGRIGAFVGTGQLDGGGGDFDSFSAGINGEFQPFSAPVSFTLGWNTYQVDDIDVDANMFRLGARWNFGGGTLRERDNATPFDTSTGVLSRALGTW